MKSRWHTYHVLVYISPVLMHLLGIVPCTLTMTISTCHQGAPILGTCRGDGSSTVMTVDRRRADSSVGEGAPERGLEVGLKLAISDRSTAKEEALSLEVKGSTNG